MSEKIIKWLVIPSLMLGMALGWTAFGLHTAVAGLVAPAGDVHRGLPSRVVVRPGTGNPAVLDTRRRVALGMIETGNKDYEIGGAGEVSRYQIMPSVWKQYSQSQDYQDPNVSLTVAQQHWTRLYNGFQKQTHREPTDFDMYVLWNTRYGYYAGKGFAPDRLNAVVRDRAQCYANLVQGGDF